MVLRETGTILPILILMRMPIKNGRPRVNAKPYQPNICAVQLRSQIFGRPSTRTAPCKRSLNGVALYDSYIFFFFEGVQDSQNAA